MSKVSSRLEAVVGKAMEDITDADLTAEVAEQVRGMRED